MEELKVAKKEVVDAYKAASDKEKKLLEGIYGKDVFNEPVDIKDKIKTFDDVLEYHNITTEQFNKDTQNHLHHEKSHRKLEMIVSALNEGWTPDWSDSREYKYYPWFKMSSSTFRPSGNVNRSTFSDASSRLCFKTQELALYAGKQFTEIYNQYMIIQ